MFIVVALDYGDPLCLYNEECEVSALSTHNLNCLVRKYKKYVIYSKDTDLYKSGGWWRCPDHL